MRHFHAADFIARARARAGASHRLVAHLRLNFWMTGLSVISSVLSLSRLAHNKNTCQRLGTHSKNEKNWTVFGCPTVTQRNRHPTARHPKSVSRRIQIYTEIPHFVVKTAIMSDHGLSLLTVNYGNQLTVFGSKSQE